VTNPTANPDTIVANGTDKTELNVTVVDDIAVDVVTIDLTPIGGAVTTMKTIDTTLYSTNTTAPIGTPAGTYYLQVNATDLLGNYNTSVTIRLNVTSSPTGSINGIISYSHNGTGIAGVNVNLTNVTGVVKTTTTNATGYYAFTDVPLGTYHVNATKPTFWNNSTAVTVTAGETVTANMMLWVKGDLSNDGSVNVIDIVMMRQAVAGLITSEWYFDLNTDGTVNVVDLTMLRQAVAGLIIL
jgi:hypothetical protein